VELLSHPAGLVTRGVSVQTLQESQLWPTWLTEESQWPRWECSEILHLQTSFNDTEQPANIEDTPWVLGKSWTFIATALF